MGSPLEVGLGPIRPPIRHHRPQVRGDDAIAIAVDGNNAIPMQLGYLA